MYRRLRGRNIWFDRLVTCCRIIRSARIYIPGIVPLVYPLIYPYPFVYPGPIRKNIFNNIALKRRTNFTLNRRSYFALNRRFCVILNRRARTVLYRRSIRYIPSIYPAAKSRSVRRHRRPIANMSAGRQRRSCPMINIW